ncbi:hypothetical protein Tco_0818674 [Tanacetum coccineum]
MFLRFRSGRLHKALEAFRSLWVHSSSIYVCPLVVMLQHLSLLPKKWYQLQGVVRLSLAKNVAFNVLNEKTTLGLLKGLSNMYEKPSASKKVFLIKQLVNTKMTEVSVILLSSLPDSWSGTVTVVSSTSGTNKWTFGSATGIGKIRIKSQCEAAKGAVNISIDAFDDGLLCCIEEYHESWVMDSGSNTCQPRAVGKVKNLKPSSLGRFVCADRKVLVCYGVLGT